jgi:hypothetical protein
VFLPDGRHFIYTAYASPGFLLYHREGALEFKAPTVLFQSPIAHPNMYLDQYDVTRDGQRFIFLKPRIDPNAATEPLAPITVVLNWQAGLVK